MRSIVNYVKKKDKIIYLLSKFIKRNNLNKEMDRIIDSLNSFLSLNHLIKK